MSNARQAAFVAVLDARHVEGAGPEEAGSPFECLSCGSVRPLTLHLASMEFLRGRGQKVELASYDARLITAARALGIPIVAL